MDYTRNIITNIKRRQQYYILYRSHRIPKLFYKNFRNHVTNQIWQAMIGFYENKFNELKPNTKKT